ncbi:hypothetical protein ES703_96057 [subsurface metagenome]
MLHPIPGAIISGLLIAIVGFILPFSVLIIVSAASTPLSYASTCGFVSYPNIASEFSTLSLVTVEWRSKVFIIGISSPTSSLTDLRISPSPSPFGIPSATIEP